MFVHYEYSGASKKLSISIPYVMDLHSLDRCDQLEGMTRERVKNVASDGTQPEHIALDEFKMELLLGSLRGAVNHFPDERTGENITYSMSDAAMGAFSVFFSQSPSFLAHQNAMEKARGKSNAQTLFGMNKIPTDNHIRNLLDPVEPKFLNPVFDFAFKTLLEKGVLKSYRSVNNTVLIALDGTQYHSSKTIHCESCNCKEHKNGTTTYSHTVVTPVIVAPGHSMVFPLEPAFVSPQDGAKKQDCENTAAKRWINLFEKRCRKLGVTLLGDDLYCHQPLCQQVLDKNLNFIFVCKPDSHKVLYEWIADFERLKTLEEVVVKRRRGKKKEIDTYRFINQVPLRDGMDALMVNWCELKTTTPEGKILYHNTFATNHEINKDNVVEIVEAGRTRWKVENENNNTLKTKGYHLSHNYGHGKKYLSSLLCTMIILAFLFHSLLELADDRYRQVRQALPRRDTFFQDIRALTRYYCFDSWEALMIFMMRGLKLELHDTS